MNKRMKIMLIVLAIIFGGIIGFNIFKKILIQYLFSHYVPPAVTVSSVKTKNTSWYPSISAVGYFSAISGVDINSQTAGNITKIHFKSGQIVEKGAPLVDIDDSVEQAELKFNQAELALQIAEHHRQEDLFKHSATPSSSVDQAKAKLLEAEANVEKAQASINQKHIIAPFSGRLGIRQVNLGQYVKPGEATIVSLQALDPIYLKFYLPEQLVGTIHVNQTITFSVEQNPNFLFKGKISAINSKSDANTHTVEIQASLNNCPSNELKYPSKSNLIDLKKSQRLGRDIVICNHKLNQQNKVTKFKFLPGMFADININQSPIRNIIVVPRTAISYTKFGDSVFIIEKDKNGEKDKDGKDILTVKRVFVTTGEEQGNYTVIEKGLTANQEIVSSGELKLQDGTRVVINNSVQLPDVKNIEQLGQ
ncbi:MAG: efflux RND transporter periplasmic adaptor subunit [Legionellaceae bacterium]|nr:efflux RND transporter periplasmic adaptor subunit [Legionellaceae bacterium]